MADKELRGFFSAAGRFVPWQAQPKDPARTEAKRLRASAERKRKAKAQKKARY